MSNWLIWTVVLSSAGISAQTVVKNQGYVPFGDAPILYRSENLSDPIAKLQKRLDSGEVKLPYEEGHGYLRSVLSALHVPVESQTLVFSKTSFQYPKISPEQPGLFTTTTMSMWGRSTKGNRLSLCRSILCRGRFST